MNMYLLFTQVIIKNNVGKSLYKIIVTPVIIFHVQIRTNSILLLSTSKQT